MTDVPICIKDGRKFEKFRKSAGDGTISNPFVPYNRIDGNTPDTASGDFAAIRDGISGNEELITGQLIMTGEAIAFSDTSQIVNTLMIMPRDIQGNIFIGDADVTADTGLLVNEPIVLKNKDLSDLYAIGTEGDILTWAAW